MTSAGRRWRCDGPAGSFLIHRYAEINRDLTWLTLSVDLPSWAQSLDGLFQAADAVIAASD